MKAPAYELAKVNAGVTALLSRGGDLRVYQFGEAPQTVVKPYMVWQLAGGSPENRLAGVPNMDNFRIQMDVYSEVSQDEARAVAEALRTAYEPYGYVVNYNFEVRELDTRLYRFSFSVEFMVGR